MKIKLNHETVLQQANVYYHKMLKKEGLLANCFGDIASMEVKAAIKALSKAVVEEIEALQECNEEEINKIWEAINGD